MHAGRPAPTTQRHETPQHQPFHYKTNSKKPIFHVGKQHFLSTTIHQTARSPPCTTLNPRVPMERASTSSWVTSNVAITPASLSDTQSMPLRDDPARAASLDFVRAAYANDAMSEMSLLVASAQPDAPESPGPVAAPQVNRWERFGWPGGAGTTRLSPRWYIWLAIAIPCVGIRLRLLWKACKRSRLPPTKLSERFVRIF